MLDLPRDEKGRFVSLCVNAETLEQWRDLLADLQGGIADDYRASDDIEDTQPGMQVTFGMEMHGQSWSYQTGDNSYTGGAYGFPVWGTVSLYRDSDPAEIARDAADQIEEQRWQ